jgi:Fe-S cluster biogenesis protein NfuA
MGPAMHPHGNTAAETKQETRPGSRNDLRATGDRIESLLEASAASSAAARSRAEELVGCVSGLYGAGLGRILEILDESGWLDDEVLAALAGDDLVASLLLVHDLHPYDVETRVRQALDSVRPYLGSHGGDVELLGVDGDGVVRLRLLGSCDGCPSSSVTLQLAVEGAVEAAAPDRHTDGRRVGGVGAGTGAGVADPRRGGRFRRGRTRRLRLPYRQ